MATGKIRSFSVRVSASPTMGQEEKSGRSRSRSVSDDARTVDPSKENLLQKFHNVSQKSNSTSGADTKPLSSSSSKIQELVRTFSIDDVMGSIQKKQAAEEAAKQEAAQIEGLHTQGALDFIGDVIDDVMGSIQKKQAAEEAAKQEAAEEAAKQEAAEKAAKQQAAEKAAKQEAAEAPAEKPKSEYSRIKEQLDEKVNALAKLPPEALEIAIHEVSESLEPIEQAILCQQEMKKDEKQDVLVALRRAVAKKIESNSSDSEQTSLPLGKDKSRERFLQYPVLNQLNAHTEEQKKASQLQAAAENLCASIRNKYTEIQNRQSTALFSSFRKYKLNLNADVKTMILHAATGGNRTRQALLDCFDKTQVSGVKKQLNLIAASQKKNRHDAVNRIIVSLVQMYQKSSHQEQSSPKLGA